MVVFSGDVGWKPVVDTWIKKLEAAEYRPLLTTLFSRYVSVLTEVLWLLAVDLKLW